MNSQDEYGCQAGDCLSDVLQASTERKERDEALLCPIVSGKKVERALTVDAPGFCPSAL